MCKGRNTPMRLGANRQRGAQSASLEDARGASYSLEMRGEEYPNGIRE